MSDLWSFPLADLSVASRDVHVWSVRLDQPAARVAHLFELLSPDERQRAQRFYFAQDERHFIVGRGVLRLLLGRYLHLPPRGVELAYGPHGKPFVPPRQSGATVSFNLAHSHELALYAFARRRELGVDIEYIRPLDDYDQIAARFFSPRETAALQAAAPPDRLTAFFRCWTRKEAYIKAVGDGLRHPLDTFDVSLEPSPRGRLLKVNGHANQLNNWTLRALAPAPGYEAALAVERAGWRLRPIRQLSVAGLLTVIGSRAEVEFRPDDTFIAEA